MRAEVKLVADFFVSERDYRADGRAFTAFWRRELSARACDCPSFKLPPEARPFIANLISVDTCAIFSPLSVGYDRNQINLAENELDISSVDNADG